MKNIEIRVQEYEKKLIDTMNGYEEALQTVENSQRIESFKQHIRKIRGIFDFGVKEYMALDSLTRINYYSENYQNLRATKELDQKYLNSFGLENREELERLLQYSANIDEIRNVIWKECFDMEYDLLSKGDVLTQIKELQGDTILTNQEKKKKIAELVCMSGYDINGISNPTSIDGGLEYLQPIMENINKENSKSI